MNIFMRTTEEERSFEKRHILSQLDKYLATDVIEKIANDPGYRAKVDLLKEKISDCKGYILDVGSNTAGECEYLVTQGYSIVATDINEHALSISSKRCHKYGRNPPFYTACDAAHLPFSNESFICVVFNESLHHMPDPCVAIREAARVLMPGGCIIMFEPYAYDPWRRISEIRDYFKGTIETSFSETQIRQFISGAGLVINELSRLVLPPSDTKLAALPLYHRILRVGYFWLKSAIPSVLGMIFCEASKPGNNLDEKPIIPFEKILVCPLSQAPLKKTRIGYLSTSANSRIGYPVMDGIPVLIASESFTVSKEVWLNAMADNTL